MKGRAVGSILRWRNALRHGLRPSQHAARMPTALLLYGIGSLAVMRMNIKSQSILSKSLSPLAPMQRLSSPCYLRSRQGTVFPSQARLSRRYWTCRASALRPHPGHLPCVRRIPKADVVERGMGLACLSLLRSRFQLEGFAGRAGWSTTSASTGCTGRMD